MSETKDLGTIRKSTGGYKQILVKSESVFGKEVKEEWMDLLDYVLLHRYVSSRTSRYALNDLFDCLELDPAARKRCLNTIVL